MRRECGADTPSHFVFSNADASTSLSRLARMHGCRFFIEHAFREAKSELAMADYQVRRWDAWHRHMALVMVAMLFLLKERLALQAEAPMLSLADLVMAINQLLPRPEPTPNRIASIIHERHMDEDRTPWLLASGGSRKYDKVELSHGGYSLFEPVVMMEENKQIFRKILNDFMDKYCFNPKLFQEDEDEEPTT